MNEVAWAISPNDRWNLISLPAKDRYFIYCDKQYWGEFALARETVKKQAQKEKRLIRQGIKDMPRRTEEYRGPEEEREAVRERRQRQAPKVGEAAIQAALSEADRARLHTQLDQLLDNYNLPPEALDKLKIKKVSTWSTAIKNNDGEFESHPMFGIQLDADPKKFTPDWPIPSRVESIKVQRKEVLTPKDVKTCIILPDLQIPFESPEALQIALDVLRTVKPDKVVFLGDLLDLSPWGKFEQQPEWATATQDAIIRAHQLLASIRKLLPAAEIDLMAGNHEERMPKTLLRNAQAAYGLKRANQLDSWPVMSIPYLLALDDLDIKYHGGYPANRLWLNRNLQIRHGNATRKKGGSARTQLAAEKVSTIFGHDHRISSSITTVNEYDGGKEIHAYGAGCLCRIDGHVPSYHQGREVDGTPIPQLEDWQRGFIVATYDEENFQVEQVPINLANKAMFRGRVYGDIA